MNLKIILIFTQIPSSKVEHDWMKTMRLTHSTLCFWINDYLITQIISSAIRKTISNANTIPSSSQEVDSIDFCNPVLKLLSNGAKKIQITFSSCLMILKSWGYLYRFSGVYIYYLLRSGIDLETLDLRPLLWEVGDFFARGWRDYETKFFMKWNLFQWVDIRAYEAYDKELIHFVKSMKHWRTESALVFIIIISYPQLAVNSC